MRSLIVALLNLLIFLFIVAGVVASIRPELIPQYYQDYVLSADPENQRIFQIAVGVLGTLFIGGMLMVIVGIYENTRRTAAALEKMTNR